MLALAAACVSSPLERSNGQSPLGTSDVSDVLLAVTPNTSGPVFGVDVGPPSGARTVLAEYILRADASVHGSEAATEFIRSVISGDIAVVPGTQDLMVLRAALALHPSPSSVIPAIDGALASSILTWTTVTSPTDRFVGLVDLARLVRSPKWNASSGRVIAALKDAAGVGSSCTNSITARMDDASSTVSGIALLSSLIPECVERLSDSAVQTPTGGDIVLLVEATRALADLHLTGSPAAEDHPVTMELSSRLARQERGPFPFGAVLPLSPIAAIMVAAEDLGIEIDVGAPQRRFAMAVRASGGALPDVVGRGSVIDGILGLAALRTVTGRVTGSVLWSPDSALSDSLGRRAQIVFGSDLEVPMDDRVQAMPSARDPVAALAYASLDVMANGTSPCSGRYDPDPFIGALNEVLVGSDLLLDPESGALPWAVLGIRALNTCSEGEAVGAADEVLAALNHRAGRGSSAPWSARVVTWATAELRCLSSAEMTMMQSSDSFEVDTRIIVLEQIMQAASSSSVYGPGSLIYFDLRVQEIEMGGCSSDALAVLTPRRK